ncbi:MAG: Crp/Fnr family transcriptional regulator [Blautia sp.]
MNVDFLSRTMLFRGVIPGEIEEMLGCLGAVSRKFSKGETICREGDVVEAMGLVLSGNVQVENIDLWGNKSILDTIGPGFVFAETYACIPGEPLMVNVIAVEPSEVLFLNTARILETCSNSCPHHNRLIRNLLSISAQKNLKLSRRIFHTSSKTIRGRVLSYLSYQASFQGSYEFTIPFNRQQLADYLGVDRSALSGELGKMQKEGLLQVDRNHFRLLEQ